MQQISLKKDGHTHVFRCSLDRKPDLIAEILRQAADRDNALDHFDARCLMHMLENVGPGTAGENPTGNGQSELEYAHRRQRAGR